MRARNVLLITLLTLFVLRSQGQTKQNSKSTITKIEKQVEAKQFEIPVYQLFPTENTWTLIKLDTRNGKIWQVHFTISKDGYEGELIINSSSLVSPYEEINGRFTLYPTQNMYNFILLDQVNGKTYKVQWHNEEEKRFIRPIY